MLLSNRMASIPCSTRHSISYMKDIQHLFKKQTPNSRLHFSAQSSTTGLQYFNMRVTQRLRRYRSMKKQWQEVAISVQNTSLSPTCESPIPQQEIPKNPSILTQKTTNETKSYCINDYINATAAAKDYNDKHSLELDPLHSRIQQDLIKLRKFIKTKQKKCAGNNSLKIPTSSRPSGDATSISAAFDDQENHSITIARKSSSLNKLKPLDRVKIAGCQMHPQTIQKSESADSGIGSTSNASSTCSQYSKQQQQHNCKTKRSNNNKTFNIYHSRVNPLPPPLPSNSFFYRSSYQSKKKLTTSARMSQNMSSKQLLSTRLSIPMSPVIEKKQPSFTKQETLLPPIRRSSDSDDKTTRQFTYAASSSSVIPRSMMLKRNTSLLPILLQSSSCIGIRPREIPSKKVEFNLGEDEQEEEEEDNNEDDDYYYLLNYNHLINSLPKPVISIHPRYGQDDYGILFEQLDHIREAMSDSNIYDDYVRTA